MHGLKRLLCTLLALVILLMTLGACTTMEPADPFYARNLYTWNGVAWVLVTGGGGGPPGPQGPPGPTGSIGPTGIPGPTGASGIPGSVWYSSSGIPNPLIGVDGDFYLDATNDDIYTKTSGSWGSPITNIKGATGSLGSQGPIGPTGTPGPAGAIGAAGPNNITTTTTTDITGIIGGNGTSVITIIAPIGSIVGTTDSQALSNKTLTSPVFSGTVGSSISLASGYNLDLINALVDDHSAGGLTSMYTAGGTVSAFDLVYIDGTSRLSRSNASAVTTMPVVAMATSATTVGNTETFITYGYVRDDSWSWTVNGLIYADSASAGALNQTPPTGVNKRVQVVAIAITSHIILFNPQLMTLGLGS